MRLFWLQLGGTYHIGPPHNLACSTLYHNGQVYWQRHRENEAFLAQVLLKEIINADT